MTFSIQLSVPQDENGYIDRQCPECGMYFKIKPGTGLKENRNCKCPYCEYESEIGSFITKEQLDYFESIVRKEAFEKIIKPGLKKIEEYLKSLEKKKQRIV